MATAVTGKTAASSMSTKVITEEVDIVGAEPITPVITTAIHSTKGIFNNKTKS